MERSTRILAAPRSHSLTASESTADFAGDEADIASRYGGATILTGDLNGDDSTGGDNSENAYTVVTALNFESMTRLDRVTLSAGNSSDIDAAVNSPLRSGGGLYVIDWTPENGELLLSNVVIDGNNANQHGGGIYNSEGNLSVLDSIISSNTGGVLNSYGVSIIGEGGGIYSKGPLFVSNTDLKENHSQYGAGIYQFEGTSRISDSKLVDGSASYGGGIYINSGDMLMTNSLVTDNWGSFGGGVYNNSVFHAVNTTIAANGASPGRGGGVYITDSTLSQVELTNSIVASNSGGDLLQNIKASLTGSHNLFGDGTGQAGVFTNTLIGTTDSPIDPFVDSDSKDFRLILGSPASDAGSTALAVYPDTSPITSDLSGAARVQDASVDMGAFEGAVFIPAQTYVVNSLGLDIAVGDGVLTLPEALAASNANLAVGDAQAGSPMEQDVIQFAPGLTGTITLNGSELIVTGDLRIEGPGATVLTIDANELSRVIRMEDPNTRNTDIPQVDVCGLTITGGKTTSESTSVYNEYDGGIYSTVDLSLDDIVVRENYAEWRGEEFTAPLLLQSTTQQFRQIMRMMEAAYTIEIVYYPSME